MATSFNRTSTGYEMYFHRWRSRYQVSQSPHPTQTSVRCGKEAPNAAWVSPLISILDHLHQNCLMPPSSQFLYSTRATAASLKTMLFFPRLQEIFSQLNPGSHHLTFFRTEDHTKSFQVPINPTPTDNKARATFEASLPEPLSRGVSNPSTEPTSNTIGQVISRRISIEDLLAALGPRAWRDNVLVYVCGPPSLTDWAVKVLKEAPGVMDEQVLFEKWW